MTRIATTSWEGDVIGGISAGIISLPISMTYGAIAFAPLGSQWVSIGILAGIYGAICACLFSLPLRGWPLLVVGPRPGTTVVFASLLTPLMAAQSGQESAPMLLLAFSFLAIAIAALLQFIAGLSCGGNVVKYIPYPVAAGFINATALLILLNFWSLRQTNAAVRGKVDQGGGPGQET